jgi:hypothetical protein
LRLAILPVPTIGVPARTIKTTHGNRTFHPVALLLIRISSITKILSNGAGKSTDSQFKAGNLDFKSTLYDWLIIAGTKAMFKGEGILNDAGSYGFQLSAIDNEVDKFRIKIWDKDAEDAVVYDNNIVADDNEEPTTELRGGSIVIHSVKKKSAEILSDKTEFNLNVYPNPFQDKVLFHFISPEDVSAQIDVYDITGRKVKTLFNDLIKKDVTYTTVFEPNAPISGIYIYRMTLGESVFTGKLVVSGR